MKRQTKKTLIASLAALLIIVLAAALVMALRTDSFGDNAFSRNRAVAKVNGEIITHNAFSFAVSSYYNNISTYNMYALYGYGTYYDISTESGMQQMKSDVLDSLIDQEVYILMAKELGITLTAEEEQEAAQAGKDALTSLKEQILESAQSSGAANPATYADTMLANYFSQTGINQRTYVDRNAHSALAEAYGEKLQEYLYNERNVTEEELADIYAEYVQTYYVDSYVDGSYSQQAEYVAEGYSDIPYLYIPEDFLFVRVIQVSDEEVYNDMMAKLDEGEDFETFVASEDNANEAVKALAEGEGQAIGENDSVFDDEVYAVAKDLAVGEVGAVKVSTADEEGAESSVWYIVKRVEGTVGVVPYEQVKELVDDILTSYAQSLYYEECLAEWKSKADIFIDDEAVAAFDPAA